MNTESRHSTWTRLGGARRHRLGMPSICTTLPWQGCVTLPAPTMRLWYRPRSSLARALPGGTRTGVPIEMTSTRHGADHRAAYTTHCAVPRRGGLSFCADGGNGKRERGSWSIIRLGPKTTLMSLHDRAADKQPDAHAPALRGVEGTEHRLQALRCETHAGIADGQTHAAAILFFRFDQQLSRAIVHVGHGLRSIAEQVQDDLLELDTIAGDDRETLGKFRVKDHAISLKFVRRQRNHLSRGL